jgi:tetratricopeptide (TPR) repeat protein
MLLIALLAASLPAAAQSWAGQGRLQGEVRDEQGKPIEGAKITLRKGEDRVDPKADGPKILTTDKRGKWSILGLAGGAWGILLEKEGFMPSEGQIKVNEYSIAQPLIITLKVPPKEAVQAAKEPSKNALAKQALEEGNVNLQAQKYSEARASYEKALGLLEVEDPVLKASIMRTIARTWYEDKQSDKAIDTLKQALAIAPDDQESLQLIVNLLVAANKEEEAKVYMAKLPQGYNDRKLEDALREFDQVVKENPNLPEAYYFRGLVYLNLSKNAEAKADFQKLLELDPKSQYADDAREFIKSL